MSDIESKLYDLLLGNKDKILPILKQLDVDHNLDLLFKTLLKICKKSLVGADLNKNCIPYLKKYFGSISTTYSTFVIEELIKYCSKEYSIKLPVELIKLLVETVQLGSAVKFREIVKNDLVKLHNALRKMKYNKEADELTMCIGNVIIVELNLLDNIDKKKLLTIWEDLNLEDEDSTTYLLMSYLINYTVNEYEHCESIEDIFCQVFEPKNDVEFSQPFLHVPLTLFKTENKIKAYKQLLNYYIEINKLDEFYEHVFTISELRNNLINDFSCCLITSTLTILFERLSTIKKRKSNDDGQKVLNFKNIFEKLLEFQKSGKFTVENAKILLNLCCKTFSKLIFSKETRAMSFGTCLIKIEKLIPSMSTDIKLFLISIMPFIILAGYSEIQMLKLMKIYDEIIDIADEKFIEIVKDNNEIYEFLNVLITRCSKDSNELRYYGSKVIAKFLNVDWRFMKNYVKNNKEVESFIPMMSTFNKTIKAPGRVPRNDIVFVYQICLHLYQIQMDVLKSKEFKPKKGIGMIVDSLMELIKSIVYSPADMIKEGTTVGGITVDLINIFIQFVRLAKLIEIEVENVKFMTPFLRHVCDEENGFDCIAQTEKNFVLNSIVKTINDYGYHADLDDFFLNIPRLISLFKCKELENEILIKILKKIGKEEELNLSEGIRSRYPLHQLKNKKEEMNSICRLLMLSINTVPKNLLADLEEYIYYMFLGTNMATIEMLEFITVYLPFVNKSKHFEDLLSIVISSLVNVTVGQFLTKSYENNIIEIKRSRAVVDVIDSIMKIGLHHIKHQMHIIGQIISKLIFNLTVFKQFVIDCREHEHRRVEVRYICDNYLKKLSTLCKNIADSDEYSSILPCIISNCLTGEREPNLPTYYLLSGCENQGIAFLSTNLPLEQKRRFGITFSNFMEKTKIVS